LKKTVATFSVASSVAYSLDQPGPSSRKKILRHAGYLTNVRKVARSDVRTQKPYYLQIFIRLLLIPSRDETSVFQSHHSDGAAVILAKNRCSTKS
jgi:hypothetical protein